MNSADLLVAVAIPRTAEQYSRPIVRGIAHTLGRAGVSTVYVSGQSYPADGDASRAGYELVKSPLVGEVITLGGLMFHAPGSAQHFARSYGERVIVNIGSDMPGAPSILCDNSNGICQAVEHLWALGRRRIAFVRGPTFSTDAAERFRGYQRGLQLCQLTFEPALVCPGAFIAQSGRKAVELMFDERGVSPDAIIAANDSSAMGAIEELRRRGLVVPDDVAVVGFDNLFDAAACHPPLTTLSQQLVEQGVRAAELVLLLREGKKVPDRILLPTTLVVRDSCGGARRAPELLQLPNVGEYSATWLEQHAEAVSDWVRQCAGWSMLELEPIKRVLGAVLADDDDEDRASVSKATSAFPEEEAWRGFVALQALREILARPVAHDPLRTQSVAERLNQAEHLVHRKVESAEAQQGNRTFLEQTSALALSQSLLGASAKQVMLDRLARQLNEHPQVRGFHVTMTEADPLWSRLVMSSGEHGTQSGTCGTRFRGQTLLPENALPARRPFNLCAARLGDDNEAWGTVLLEVVPEYVNRAGLLADQMTLWLATHRADASPEPNNQAPRIPHFIGRYRVEYCIGIGGSATVFLAHTEVAGVARPVALKLLKQGLQEGGLDQLMEEARLTASIRHPNVVQVIELGECELGVFLVMDFIDGCNLSRLLSAAQARQERIPLRIVGRVLSDCLGGLHAAHELRDPDGFAVRLVHRDVSLQNILVGIDGITKITDFGIALTHTQADTERGVLKGKLRYMAPEQLRSEPVDRRADLWSIGAVAWELLAGKRLYDGDRQAVLRRRIVSEVPPRLASMVPVPTALDALVARTLSLQPEHRPRTAKELRRALTHIFEQEGGIADTEEVGSYVAERIGQRGRLVTGSSPPSETDQLAPGAKLS